METVHEIETVEVEFLLDCTQPQLCDCFECDTARRAQVQAFAARWLAASIVDEQSGIRTVRPPAFVQAA